MSAHKYDQYSSSNMRSNQSPQQNPSNRLIGSQGSMSQIPSSIGRTGGNRLNAHINEDAGSPEIVQELLDTNSEWMNI